jgi:hypothetical protein
MDSSTVWLIVIFGGYFLPWINAQLRHHRSKAAIAVINVFLGWTLVGWVIALAWSCTDNVRPPEPRSSGGRPTPVPERRGYDLEDAVIKRLRGAAGADYND